MITFAYATQADLPQIVAIYNQSIKTLQSTADLKPVSVASKQGWFETFNRENRPIWKILVAGEMAGWIGLESFYGRPAYRHTAEVSLYVDSAFHRQGLGQKALTHVFERLPSLNLDTLVAFVFSHNEASQALFKQNSFQVWGHLSDVALMAGQKRSLDILGRHFRYF